MNTALVIPARRVPTSVTGGIRDRIKSLTAAGDQVCRLDAGEVDYEPPNIGVPAPGTAADDLNLYGPPLGLSALRDAIFETRGVYPAGLGSADVLVTNGAKQAVFLALSVLGGPGTHVLVGAPYWVSYLPMLELTGGRPIVGHASETSGYKVTPDLLDNLRTPRTSTLIINSPANPSGSVYTLDELEAIAQWANRNGIWILSDEIYRHIYFGDESSAPSIAQTSAEKYVIVDGLSKAYAMAGWRVGWLIAPPEVLEAAKAVMSHTTSHVSNYPQLIAVRALRDPTYLPRVRNELHERRDILYSMVLAAGLDCYEPQGSIYTFPSIEPLIGRTIAGIRIADDLTASEALLVGGGIASVPGSAFGQPGNLRLGYGRNRSELATAGRRLIATLN